MLVSNSRAAAVDPSLRRGLVDHAHASGTVHRDVKPRKAPGWLLTFVFVVDTLLIR